MSKKVILIEDRKNRQKIFTENFSKQIEDFSCISNICGGEEISIIQKELKEYNFERFNPFQVILIHRSFLANTREDMLTKFIQFTEEVNKDLVIFSGGISSTLLQTFGDRTRLTIHSKDFYSNNLMLYLENDAKEIGELAFGANWKVNIKVREIEQIHTFVNNNKEEEIPVAAVKSRVNSDLTSLAKYLNGENLTKLSKQKWLGYAEFLSNQINVC